MNWYWCLSGIYMTSCISSVFKSKIWLWVNQYIWDISHVRSHNYKNFNGYNDYELWAFLFVWNFWDKSREKCGTVQDLKVVCLKHTFCSKSKRKLQLFLGTERIISFRYCLFFQKNTHFLRYIRKRKFLKNNFLERQNKTLGKIGPHNFTQTVIGYAGNHRFHVINKRPSNKAKNLSSWKTKLCRHTRDVEVWNYSTPSKAPKTQRIRFYINLKSAIHSLPSKGCPVTRFEVCTFCSQ